MKITQDDVLLCDVTLRDGNHALRHSLRPNEVSDYCRLADSAGLFSVEVGHGNGLGASSHLVGKSAASDFDLLSAARANLLKTKLSVHVIPGFATLKRDVLPAIDLGVDIFRVAAHVTEADVTQTHIERLSSLGANAHGVLMMSHMASVEQLVLQAELLESYGAGAVIFMDSAGTYRPNDVRERVRALSESLTVPIGFHAHNNLGLGVANALAAMESGASLIDGSSMGLGAGAGNAQLEAIAANLDASAVDRDRLDAHFAMSDFVKDKFREMLPVLSASSIGSGMVGAFSGYAPQVSQVSAATGISTRRIWEAIGDRKLVAGQETMIDEIAQDLMNL